MCVYLAPIVKLVVITIFVGTTKYDRKYDQKYDNYAACTPT